MYGSEWSFHLFFFFVVRCWLRSSQFFQFILWNKDKSTPWRTKRIILNYRPQFAIKHIHTPEWQNNKREKKSHTTARWFLYYAVISELEFIIIFGNSHQSKWSYTWVINAQHLIVDDLEEKISLSMCSNQGQEKC